VHSDWFHLVSSDSLAQSLDEIHFILHTVKKLKKSHFSSDDQSLPAYSTDPTTNKLGRNSKAPRTVSYTQGKGPARIRLEKKGRAGKIVTVIENIPISEDEAMVILKDLKVRLGCGGTLKESSIVLQGNVATESAKILSESWSLLAKIC
jgi:predicted translation initiation factor SUI1